jgi:glucose/arabinose dehydrogenase
MNSSSLRLIAAVMLAAGTAPAQNGDKPGHDMAPPPAHWKIPAAPVVDAADAKATMALEEGFSLELVASEPMLKDPVALAFDGNGRIWVAEMTGYMPDIDGKLEESTHGRISVLEDTDGDGKADQHTVFLAPWRSWMPTRPSFSPTTRSSTRPPSSSTRRVRSRRAK